MCIFREKNGDNPHFWAKRTILIIFGQKGVIFEPKTSLFYSFFFQNKNQKVLMRRFSGKLAWTNVQTEVNPKFSADGKKEWANERGLF